MTSNWTLLVLLYCCSLVKTHEVGFCSALRKGQYRCLNPDIDPDTQQARGCTKEKQTVPVDCLPAPGITCKVCLDQSCSESSVVIHNGTTVGFQKEVECNWTNGYSFDVALLLSIFLGMFGVDRFYLGYPAIGLLKFCTLGFMFLGQLVDILLIALQVVAPSDGSHYIISYYGAGLTRIVRDFSTENATID